MNGKDIHSTINIIDINEMGNLKMYEKYLINLIATSHRILEYIKECLVLHNNDNIYLDN